MHLTLPKLLDEAAARKTPDSREYRITGRTYGNLPRSRGKA